MNIDENETIGKLARKDIWEQLNQTQEECAELIAAINRLRRNKQGAYGEAVEEIADVSIMMAQCKIIIGQELVEQKIREKLARCKERLKNGSL